MDSESHEGDTDSDESNKSNKSPKLPIPLETAARLNPEIAHRALAAQPGLIYDEIQKFMGRAKKGTAKGTPFPATACGLAWPHPISRLHFADPSLESRPHFSII